MELDFEHLLDNKGNWKDNLKKTLSKDFVVILPSMPNKSNAQYPEWKIWFEKLIPHCRTGLILVGHSLGGIFLAKYLSENIFPKKISAVFLVAAPYDIRSAHNRLASFGLPAKLVRLQEQVAKIFIYHSQDDPVVPVIAAKNYQHALPGAVVKIFKNKQHFNQATFPEIVKTINSPSKRARMSP